MTVEQVRRYTVLVRRRSELIKQSGASWQDGYNQEIKDIDTELKRLRGEMEKERKGRK